MLDGIWLSIHYLSMFILSEWLCETHVCVGDETVLKYQGNIMCTGAKLLANILNSNLVSVLWETDQML